MALLIAEDDDRKFSDICEVLDKHFESRFTVTRTSNVIDTEDAALSGEYPMCVLDISMNIAPGASASSVRGGHADLGGMEVVEKLFYYDAPLKIVILTGYDLFEATPQAKGGKVLRGIEEIRAQAELMLGERLIATVRYGVAGWEAQFSEAISHLVK